MNISIPEQYRNRFTKKTLFIIRYKAGEGLLLMSHNEHQSLIKRFDSITNKGNFGLARFIKASAEEVDIKDWTIEISEFLEIWLKGNERKYKQDDVGLLLY